MAVENAISVKEGDLIKERYLVTRLIGKGTFGHVFLGQDKFNSDRRVAIKVEGPDNAKGLHPISLLYWENTVLKNIHRGRPGDDIIRSRVAGFPRVHHFGRHNKGDYVLVMDLLGPSLEDLFVNCERQFSLKTVLLLVDQLLRRIYYLHEIGYIHRDLKPQNLLMGISGDYQNMIHLIDFGLAKSYWNNWKPGEHIKETFCKEKSRIGTLRYMSVRSHHLQEVSRRDDMESLAYVMAYFLNGKLPWQHVVAATRKQKNEKVAEIKAITTPENLFDGCPLEFAYYLTLVNKLKFNEKPKYGAYQKMFQELGKRHSVLYSLRGQFDWMLSEPKKEEKENDAKAITNAA